VSPAAYSLKSRLAENDGACLAQRIDRECILWGPIVLEHCVPSVVGIPAVSISSYKNAVKQTDQARGPVGRVQAVGVFERVVVERDDRIDIRPTLVKGGDGSR
jgi:hypothetical protein